MIVEPVSIEKMSGKRTKGTICDVLRDIYHGTEDEVIRYKCRVATTMAKSMHLKLKEYKKGTA